MKRIFLICLVISVVVIGFSPVEAKRVYEFKTSPKNSNIHVQFVDQRPIIMHASGENAVTNTNMFNGSFKDYLSMKSEGRFNILQTVNHNGVKVETTGYSGSAVSEIITKNYKSTVVLESLGKINLDRLAGREDVTINVEGSEGFAEIKNLTEKYRNQGKVISKGDIALNGNIKKGSLRLQISGENGSATSLTTMQEVKNGGSIESLGGMRVSTVLKNPGIQLEIEGKRGEAAVQALSDKLYNKEINVDSLGEISLSQLAKRHEVFLNLDWTRGDVTSITSTPDQETKVVLVDAEGKLREELEVEGEGTNEEGRENQPAKRENTSKEINLSNANTGSNGSTVVAQAELSSKKEGKLTVILMNPRRGPELSDAEIVSRRMGMGIHDAKNYIRDNGGMGKINYAWEKAQSYNPRPPEPKVAGKAGGMVGPVSINVQNLSPPSVYKLHLQGPKYKGFLRNSILYMRLYYPTNGRQINGLYTTITVAEPEPSGDILLVQELPYDNQEEYYTYSFDAEDWLVDFDKLSGPYILMIDSGQSMNTRLKVTITEDGRIIPRSS